MEIEIKGVPVCYEKFGEGTPIICIHGFPEDHRAMMGCVEPLFDHVSGYCRIYIDLPGMGRSPAHPEVKNADQMLDILQHLIRMITEDTPYLLMGQSYGGYLSLGLAHRFPALIDGIFLLCPCTVANRSDRKLPKRHPVILQEPRLTDDDDPEDYREFLEMAAVVSPEIWRRYKTEVLAGLQSADEAFCKRYQEQGYAFSFENELSEKTYQKPVCILTGRADDCVGYEDTFRLVKAFPRTTFTVLAGAGHNLQLEAPSSFKSHFRLWLEQVEANKRT